MSFWKDANFSWNTPEPETVFEKNVAVIMMKMTASSSLLPLLLLPLRVVKLLLMSDDRFFEVIMLDLVCKRITSVANIKSVQMEETASV